MVSSRFLNLIDTWYQRAILFENKKITYNDESLYTTEYDRLHTTMKVYIQLNMRDYIQQCKNA